MADADADASAKSGERRRGWPCLPCNATGPGGLERGGRKEWVGERVMGGCRGTGECNGRAPAGVACPGEDGSRGGTNPNPSCCGCEAAEEEGATRAAW
jgi:hypothetical protein